MVIPTEDRSNFSNGRWDQLESLRYGSKKPRRKSSSAMGTAMISNEKRINKNRLSEFFVSNNAHGLIDSRFPNKSGANPRVLNSFHSRFIRQSNIQIAAPIKTTAMDDGEIRIGKRCRINAKPKPKRAVIQISLKIAMLKVTVGD